MRLTLPCHVKNSSMLTPAENTVCNVAEGWSVLLWVSRFLWSVLFRSSMMTGILTSVYTCPVIQMWCSWWKYITRPDVYRSSHHYSDLNISRGSAHPMTLVGMRWGIWTTWPLEYQINKCMVFLSEMNQTQKCFSYWEPRAKRTKTHVYVFVSCELWKLSLSICRSEIIS